NGREGCSNDVSRKGSKMNSCCLSSQHEASANATDTEDLVFPEKEEAGRCKTLSNERKRYFARLSFFLMGDKAGSLNPAAARSYGRRGVQQPTAGSDPLQQSLVLLFGDATACQLEALQATLLYAYFNVPFTQDRLDAALRDEDVFLAVEHGFLDPLGGTAINSYLQFDREKSRQAQEYVAQFMRRLTQIASVEIAAPRAERAVGGVADQRALTRELQVVLTQPDNKSIPAKSAKNRDEIEALFVRMQTYIRRAAEPARIRAYVHARIDELEEALRTTVPDKQFERLAKRVEGALFPTEAALVTLEREPIEQIVTRTNLLIDRWFQKD